MILTGNEINDCVNRAEITISPFNKEQLNPNSYNYKIDDKISVPIIKNGVVSHFEEQIIPKKGLLLKAHQLYLANTFEEIGSDYYSISLIGRSSIGRLGLFLQISANLGHIGSCHKWTLELIAAKPFVIYPFMIIGQVSFWENLGEKLLYKGGYSAYNFPKPSKLFNNR